MPGSSQATEALPDIALYIRLAAAPSTISPTRSFFSPGGGSVQFLLVTVRLPDKFVYPSACAVAAVATDSSAKAANALCMLTSRSRGNDHCDPHGASRP